MAAPKCRPNWKSNRSISGGTGYRDDMVRFYPTPTGEACPVRVEIMSWVGVAVGASHEHVSIKPAVNPVWDQRQRAWVSFWDDPQRDDPEPRHARLVGGARALRWAVRTVEAHFPAPEWAVKWPVGVDPSTVLPDAAEDAAVAECHFCGLPQSEHDQERRADCDRYAAMEAASSGYRTIVNAGAVFGVVGREVLVLSDMHPSHVALLAQCKALLVEVGGATAHLAQVATEMGVTVMLVPDAVTRFPTGTSVYINPDHGEVTPTASPSAPSGAPCAPPASSR